MGQRSTKVILSPKATSSKEKKTIETVSAAYAADTTGSVTAINLVATGTDFTDRIGRLIQLKSVQVRGLLSPEANITDDNLARVLVIYDKQPNGTLATIADILTAASSVSFMNLNNRDRFTVLAEHSVALGAVNNTATQAVAKSPTVDSIDIYKKINLQTQFGLATGVIGAVQHGALLLVTIGSVALGTTCQLACRVRFEDV